MRYTVYRFFKESFYILAKVDVSAIRNGKESSSIQDFYHTPIPEPQNFRVHDANLTEIRVKKAFKPVNASFNIF